MVEAKGKMPDYPDVDGDGNKDEPISQAQKDRLECSRLPVRAVQ